MLQQTVPEPRKASTLTLSLAHDTDTRTTSPGACMNVSRITLDVSANQRIGLVQQEHYIRNCFAAPEFLKQESGMSVNTGAHSKRSFIEGSSKGESVEHVEWKGFTRGNKRREVSLERESGPVIYTEADHHHLHHRLQSGSSDLTTEQSVVCMAADESNSTRSTSSLNEDTCLLKLHSAASQALSYGDADEYDHSSNLACSNVMQASPPCEIYNVSHAACAGSSQYPSLFGAEHWQLASASHILRNSTACANYSDYHIQASPLHDYGQHDVEVESDWLDLRLGRNDVRSNGVSGTSRSSSPHTLQLLPQEPDCTMMKQREINRELKLYRDEHDEGKALRPFEQAELLGSGQARPALMGLEGHVDHPGSGRESNQDVYSNLKKASCLPMAPANGTIGQYITSRGLLPIHNHTNSVGRSSCNPRISALEHPSIHMQQLLQDGNIHSRLSLPSDTLFQSRAASQNTLQGQTSSFKSMVCSSFHEGMAGTHALTRLPLLDYSQQYNWDLLPSSSSPPSCSMLQPAATSFRDLVASSFVKEPLNKLDYTSGDTLFPTVLRPVQPHNGDTLSKRVTWPCSKIQQSHSPTNLMSSPSYLAMANDRLNTSMDMENGHHGSKSMSEWLSEALSATGFNSQLNHRVTEHGDLNEDDFNVANRMEKAIHGSKSKHQPPLKLITRGQSIDRGSPGFWFALQPGTPESEGSSSTEEGLQSKTSYIRLKDGNVPLSLVKKFVIAKLGLSPESQVGFACRGKLLEEATYLKSVQNDIWIPPNFVQNETFNFKSASTSNIPKDNVMILTYQILSRQSY